MKLFKYELVLSNNLFKSEHNFYCRFTPFANSTEKCLNRNTCKDIIQFSEVSAEAVEEHDS